MTHPDHDPVIPGTQPIRLFHTEIDGNGRHFNPKLLEEFLGEGWKHFPIDNSDFFILNNPETKLSLRLMFERNSDSDLFFRAFTRGNDQLLWGNNGVFMRGVSSIDLLPDGIGFSRTPVLRVVSDGAEFRLGLDPLHGLLEAGQGNTCYFDYSGVRTSAVSPIEIVPNPSE